MTTPAPSIAGSVDVSDIERHLALLVGGSTFEVRAFVRERGRDFPLYGYFRSPTKATAEIAKRFGDDTTKAVYLTLNPVRDELYARCADRFDVAQRAGTTGDSHIMRRARLLVDVDAAPVAGISTSDAEHEAALGLAWEIAADLYE